MKFNKKDKEGKDLFTSDIVLFEKEKYKVRYGNYTYMGTERIGFYIEELKPSRKKFPLTSRVKKIS